MFIVKLYRHSKLLFIAFIVFILLQLFINLKRGLTATPFLHYGMYSGYMPTPPMIEVWEIYADSTRINLMDFNPKVADCITEPLRLYDQLGASNGLYYTHISRFLKPSIFDSTGFISHLSIENFANWYRQVLENIIDKEVNELRVYKSYYAVQKADLILKNKSLYIYDNK